MSQCKNCGVEIGWVLVENKQGQMKPHPVDTPSRSIYPKFPGDDVGIIVSKSHYDTCPNQPERGSRGGGSGQRRQQPARNQQREDDPDSF